MRYDIELLADLPPGNAVFRLYSWQPYCISLGYHQSESILRKELLKEDNIDMVFRPTGGKAVLHADELTYSIIIAAEEKLNPLKIYEAINSALLEGLTIYHEKLAGCVLESVQPDFRAIKNDPFAEGCFTTPAKSELKFAGRKFCGSAQKYDRNKILQHGSILTGGFHKKLPYYLHLSEGMEMKMTEMLDGSSTDLSEILGRGIDINKLKISLFEGLKKYLKKNTKHIFQEVKTEAV